jgi:protein-disulfide isomerase
VEALGTVRVVKDRATDLPILAENRRDTQQGEEDDVPVSPLAQVTGIALLLGTVATLTLAAQDETEGQPPVIDPAEQSPAQSAAQQDPDPLIRQRTKGDPTAPLTLYEISDFQCPYCGVFAQEIFPQLDREYIATGKMQIVFVNLPLIQLHPNAAAAHEFAMCAALQDRFWPIHDLLFRTQATWSPQTTPADFFMTLADSATLDRDSLTGCIETGGLRWLVETEATAVAGRGVRSTPSFIIEQILVKGVQPMDVWRPLLDSLWVAKTGGT